MTSFVDYTRKRQVTNRHLPFNIVLCHGRSGTPCFSPKPGWFSSSFPLLMTRTNIHSVAQATTQESALTFLLLPSVHQQGLQSTTEQISHLHHFCPGPASQHLVPHARDTPHASSPAALGSQDKSQPPCWEIKPNVPATWGQDSTWTALPLPTSLTLTPTQVPSLQPHQPV